MSSRRHQSQSIPWLEHRAGFPSETERQLLIHRREDLDNELLPIMLDNFDPDGPKMIKLVDKYGWDEVDRAIKSFSNSMHRPSFIADEAAALREYRHRYACFGGQRPFYSYQDLDVLLDEILRLNIDRHKSGYIQSKKPREIELDNLLLTGWRSWEDITPPAVPSRPSDFKSPTPAVYRDPVAGLLTWGTDLDMERITDEAEQPERWLSQLPALERMALDPGLLDGWPGDPGSWAHWHALQLLGSLEAWQSVPALAALSGRSNDWLSDQLPGAWARMGLAVEPILWVFLEDVQAQTNRRGLAAEALTLLADDEPRLSGKIAQGFGQIVQKAQPCDPTLNACLIYFTKMIGEVKRIRPIIESAFADHRVDEHIITQADLGEED